MGWRPPLGDWLKLNTDGAISGNAHNAHASGLIRNGNGHWVSGFIMNIGNCTILRAELWGLFQGLSLAWSIGVRKLHVECDNKLVV